MFPQQWSSPCGTQCTSKYAALMQIPWRVFCKKGCDSDGETWEECLGECNEICYKDPVLKDQQWSAYIDRSPGADNYSVGPSWITPGSHLDDFWRSWDSKNSKPLQNGMLPCLCGGLWLQDSSAKMFSIMDLMSRDISLLVLGNVCTPGQQKGALFSIPPETVTRVHPNRPPKACIVRKPPQSPVEPITTAEDVPCTSA